MEQQRDLVGHPNESMTDDEDNDQNEKFPKFTNQLPIIPNRKQTVPQYQSVFEDFKIMLDRISRLPIVEVENFCNTLYSYISPTKKRSNDIVKKRKADCGSLNSDLNNKKMKINHQSNPLDLSFSIPSVSALDLRVKDSSNQMKMEATTLPIVPEPRETFSRDPRLRKQPVGGEKIEKPKPDFLGPKPVQPVIWPGLNKLPNEDPQPRRIRTSETFDYVQNLIEQKRAAKEKARVIQAEEELQRPTIKPPSQRVVGKEFSPTSYSPCKAVVVADGVVQASVPKLPSVTSKNKDIFLLVILSMDVQLLFSEQPSEDSFIQSMQNLYNKFLNYQNIDSGMPFEFDDFKQYKDVLTKMIIHETVAQIIDANQNGSVSSPEILMTLTPSEVDEENFINLVFKVSVETKNLFNDKHQFANWIVKIRPKNQTVAVFGFISEIHQDNKNSLVIRYIVKMARHIFEQKFLPAKIAAKSSDVLFKPILYLKPTLRLIESLTILENRDRFCNILLKPDYDICSFEDLLSGSNFSTFPFHDANIYNNIQKKTIMACYVATRLPYATSKILLVQGPPGTGKTHTLIGVIKNIFANNEMDKEKPLRILVCAPSNGAIDEIGRRLIQQRAFLRQYRNGKSLRIVRIGRAQQVHPDVASIVLDQLIDMNINLAISQKEPNSELIMKRTQVREDILLNADVILSTLSSSQTSAMDIFREVSSKHAIRCLIVDEASQCVEPELLMPLIYPSITKIILIGDPLQLPATVISVKAQKLNFNRSLFERFYQYFWQRCDPRRFPVLQLIDQYRMHEEICRFPSNSFYGSRLRTIPGSGNHPAIKIHPYTVFNITDSREKIRNSSMANETEAEFISKLLGQILIKICYKEESDKFPASIGIITFYRGQKLAISDLIAQRYSAKVAQNVEVNTVDGFQGQERDIIILSCVRAVNQNADLNCGQSIGFLRSPQRMNVALTRARSLLCICLQGKAFENSPLWQSLITDAQNRLRLFPVNSEITDQQIGLLLL